MGISIFLPWYGCEFTQRKTRPPKRTGLNRPQYRRPFRVNYILEMLNASAAVPVFPVLLDHPVIVAEGLVELRARGISSSGAKAASGTSFSGAEVEVALVAIFLAVCIKPGIQVRIRNGFFLFMRKDV